MSGKININEDKYIIEFISTDGSEKVLFETEIDLAKEPQLDGEITNTSLD